MIPVKIKIMEQPTLPELKVAPARAASPANMAREKEGNAGKIMWAIFYFVMSVGRRKSAMWVRLARTHSHEG